MDNAPPTVSLTISDTPFPLGRLAFFALASLACLCPTRPLKLNLSSSCHHHYLLTPSPSPLFPLPFFLHLLLRPFSPAFPPPFIFLSFSVAFASSLIRAGILLFVCKRSCASKSIGVRCGGDPCTRLEEISLDVGKDRPLAYLKRRRLHTTICRHFSQTFSTLPTQTIVVCSRQPPFPAILSPSRGCSTKPISPHDALHLSQTIPFCFRLYLSTYPCPALYPLSQIDPSLASPGSKRLGLLPQTPVSAFSGAKTSHLLPPGPFPARSGANGRCLLLQSLPLRSRRCPAPPPRITGLGGWPRRRALWALRRALPAISGTPVHLRETIICPVENRASSPVENRAKKFSTSFVKSLKRRELTFDLSCRKYVKNYLKIISNSKIITIFAVPKLRRSAPNQLILSDLGDV